MKASLYSLFSFFMILLFSHPAQAQIITTVAGNGYGAATPVGYTGGYTGDNGPATNAELYYPLGVAVNSSGVIYIADQVNRVIRKVSTSGIITTIAGGGAVLPDDVPATAAGLGCPDDITVDGAGNIFIADECGPYICKVTSSGIITIIAGDGLANPADGGPATAAELGTPYCVAVDGAGNVYIGDCEWGVIWKVNVSGIISAFAGNGTIGNSGDNGPATAAELNAPRGLAVDGSGNVYISDGNNNNVRKVSPGGIITTIAGGGTVYPGDGGPATDAQLGGNTGIKVDSHGNVYFTDGNQGFIRKVNTSGIISTIAGNGTAGYNGDNIPATAAEFDFPYGIALDASGNIYIADALNNRVRLVRYNEGVPAPPGLRQGEVHVWPNPAINTLNITSTEKITAITISDLLGQVVASPGPSQGGEVLSVDVSALPAGVYFVKISGSAGLTMTRKFVKE